MSCDKFYTDLQLWYENYVHDFLGKNPDLDNAVNMKVEHTRRVCDVMNLLCESLELDSEDYCLALTTALLHDVGRYEQYEKYQTFSDFKSVNHAELALEVIEKHNLLGTLTKENAELVRTAIHFHNVRELPLELNKRKQMFCKLIRDADKADIFRIAVNHYLNQEVMPKNLLNEVSDTDKISPEVCRAVYNGESVDYKKIKSLNDFKLVQIGWIYDLNFEATFKLLKENGYLLVIKNQLALPPGAEAMRAVDKALEYLDNKAGQ